MNELTHMLKKQINSTQIIIQCFLVECLKKTLSTVNITFDVKDKQTGRHTGVGRWNKYTGTISKTVFTYRRNSAATVHHSWIKQIKKFN